MICCLIIHCQSESELLSGNTGTEGFLTQRGTFQWAPGRQRLDVNVMLVFRRSADIHWVQRAAAQL